MEKVKGIITAVHEKDGKYGIAIGRDNWYNGHGKCPCQKGDEVEITYEQNEQWKNIKQVYVSKQKPKVKDEFKPNTEIQQMSKLKNQTNARISALTNANNLCIARNEQEVNNVLSLAKTFLGFIED